MTRFVVKSTSVATEFNPNFAGETLVCYYGKGEKMICREGTHYSQDNFIATKHNLIEFGYKRECDAKRSWIYKNPNTDIECKLNFWKNTVEIVKVEV